MFYSNRKYTSFYASLCDATLSTSCACKYLLLSISPNDGSLSLRKQAEAELLPVLGVVIEGCS